MTAPSLLRRISALLMVFLSNNRGGGGGVYSFVSQAGRQKNQQHTISPARPLFMVPDNENAGDEEAIISSTVTTSGTSGAGGASTLLALSPRLSPLEAWCVTHMDVWYSRSLSIKCPFLKRRSADLLDGLDMMMRFLVIRHKSLDLIGPPPGCRSMRNSASHHHHHHHPTKHRHTTWDERLDMIRHDWRPQSHKGYYITGRLNTTLYRDDCFFDGPDPDMPVKGLRKYLNAASHLFDHATSTAELLALEIVEQPGLKSTLSSSSSSSSSSTVIVAKWRLQGVLHLPWHPQLPVWTGQTTYHFDDDGLIHLHEEAWDISVAQAFLETLWPDMASRIWTSTTRSTTTTTKEQVAGASAPASAAASASHSQQQQQQQPAVVVQLGKALTTSPTSSSR